MELKSLFQALPSPEPWVVVLGAQDDMQPFKKAIGLNRVSSNTTYHVPLQQQNMNQNPLLASFVVLQELEACDGPPPPPPSPEPFCHSLLMLSLLSTVSVSARSLLGPPGFC